MQEKQPGKDADGKDPNQSDTAGGRTALHWAVRNGNMEIVDLLLENGADPDKGDQAGKTALSHAAESSKVEMTRKLIEAGADVNKRDLVGGNSVLWAAGLGNDETLKIVVDAGGVSLSTVRHISVIKAIAKIGPANYPETTRKVYIVNAPAGAWVVGSSNSRLEEQACAETTRLVLTPSAPASIASFVRRRISAMSSGVAGSFFAPRSPIT